MIYKTPLIRLELASNSPRTRLRLVCMDLSFSSPAKISLLIEEGKVIGLDIIVHQKRVLLPLCSFIPLPTSLLDKNVSYEGEVKYHRDSKIQLIEVEGSTLRKV